MQNILYFAYGSNLNAEQMRKRCPGAKEFSRAVLPGWKLARRGFADIEPAPKARVNGALYAIGRDDLASLDFYEGYPALYDRREVLVYDGGGVFRKALAYVMTEKYRTDLENVSFTEKYSKECFLGAEYWGIPNAFALGESEETTLWTEAVPEIPEGLERLLERLDGGGKLPCAETMWIGARVVISKKPQSLRGDFDFYPAPAEIVTPHARELSWIFNDLRDLFVQGKFLDSINKFAFFGALAESASDAIAADPAIRADKLCRIVAEKAREFYREGTR